MGLFIKERKEALLGISQGLFIWLDTMISFIAKEGNGDAVDKVLAEASRSEPEASLDILYRAVVKSAAEKTGISKIVVPLIIGFVVASSSTRPLMPRVIHALLPPEHLVTLDDVEFSLAHLNAILVRRDHGIEAAHPSILDFSADKKRCGEDIWVDPVGVQQTLAMGCLEIMQHGTRNAKRQLEAPSGLRFNICNLVSSSLRDQEVEDLRQRIEKNISSELLYSSLFWVKHVVDYSLITESLERGASRDQNTLDLSQILMAFLPTEQSLYWLEVLSLTDNLERAGSRYWGEEDMLGAINKYSHFPVSFFFPNPSINADKCLCHRYLAHSRNSR